MGPHSGARGRAHVLTRACIYAHTRPAPLTRAGGRSGHRSGPAAGQKLQQDVSPRVGLLVPTQSPVSRRIPFSTKNLSGGGELLPDSLSDTLLISSRADFRGRRPGGPSPRAFDLQVDPRPVSPGDRNSDSQHPARTRGRGCGGHFSRMLALDTCQVLVLTLNDADHSVKPPPGKPRTERLPLQRTPRLSVRLSPPAAPRRSAPRAPGFCTASLTDVSVVLSCSKKDNEFPLTSGPWISLEHSMGFTPAVKSPHVIEGPQKCHRSDSVDTAPVRRAGRSSACAQELAVEREGQGEPVRPPTSQQDRGPRRGSGYPDGPEPVRLRLGSASSPLLSSVMLKVLFVYVVLALYLMSPRTFDSSLAFYEGARPAQPGFLPPSVKGRPGRHLVGGI